MKKTVGIGLIGSGFMGKCHANAFSSVAGIFDLPARPNKIMLADISSKVAKNASEQFGFAEYTEHWQELVVHPEVDIVAITAPNIFHAPMALAAIKANKTVYCEKPLSTTYASAKIMRDAAEENSIVTSVGFNFLRNPMIAAAKEIIQSGEIGEITAFRARHAENYMADPLIPHSFRTDPEGGGALADIGSHIISILRYLLGPVAKVNAQMTTIYKQRPEAQDLTKSKPVLVDDMTHALIEFENGVCGSMEANWAATGRNMDLSFEVTGSKGALAFTQERMNELLLFTGSYGRAGYKKIEAGPDHSPYGNFCPAGGHHLGFNDLKVIEVAELITAHAQDGRCFPDFREAAEVQKTIEAMQKASIERTWVAP